MSETIDGNDATRRDLVLGMVRDAVTDLLYYDRKGCEDLPVGEIERLVADGTVTVDDMVRAFRSELEDMMRQR